MKRLLSTLVLHKPTNETDTRLALMRGLFVQTPLQKQLGVMTCGNFQQADKDQQWASKPVEKLWLDEQLKDATSQTGKDVAKNSTPLEEHQYHLQPSRNPSEDRRTLTKLHKAISDSHNKLCFIRLTMADGNRKEWRLAQIATDDCNPTT